MAYAQTHDVTSKAPAGPVNLGVVYTCQMHPQIRQTRPGNCPICGLTLELVKTRGESKFKR